MCPPSKGLGIIHGHLVFLPRTQNLKPKTYIFTRWGAV
jgi:hypothetical protein